MMSLTSFTCFHISGVTDVKENRFFPPSESFKTADLELWSVDGCPTTGILFLYSRFSFFPLYMVVGLFGQIISLNMLKLHGGDQNYSPETNLPSHQGSLVLQVKTNVEINPMDDLFL